ncbi:oxamate carbamoyltransferase subunit AllG family protein [Paraburkholderia flagellata]|uniref:oxamate carbamoyltransferase subunit AllG family protein n=1 Tax=Paraburkholderia flagellata TaxID=2883241 RepID=UPI001F2E37A0|nr:DUF1116 domain-containing protein [Paraburkholderia flagellata]
MNISVSIEQDDVHAADAEALARMTRVRPQLVGVATAREVMALGRRTLLHAGPPVQSTRELVAPVRHSAQLALLFEGWAASRDEAERMIANGEISFAAAQDHDAAIPLADVLSPSMAVLVVADANDAKRRSFSTINGGDGPVMRVGQFSDAVLERLKWINRMLAPQLACALDGVSVDLIAIADAAFASGEDCHGSTRAASANLADTLCALDGAQALDTEARTFLREAGAFFLNAWMAAVKNIFMAAEGVARSSVVTAIGGNGARFGIRISGAPGRWFTGVSSAPRIPGADAALQAAALGAIGDSAIVDAFGGGAMAAAFASATQARLAIVLGERGFGFPGELLGTSHTGFVKADALRVGLCARRVIELRQTPIVSLGALDREGERGRLDGGFHIADIAPFAASLNALGDHHAAA